MQGVRLWAGGKPTLNGCNGFGIAVQFHQFTCQVQPVVFFGGSEVRGLPKCIQGALLPVQMGIGDAYQRPSLWVGMPHTASVGINVSLFSSFFIVSREQIGQRQIECRPGFTRWGMSTVQLLEEADRRVILVCGQKQGSDVYRLSFTQ